MYHLKTKATSIRNRMEQKCWILGGVSRLKMVNNCHSFRLTCTLVHQFKKYQIRITKWSVIKVVNKIRLAFADLTDICFNHKMARISQTILLKDWPLRAQYSHKKENSGRRGFKSTNRFSWLVDIFDLLISDLTLTMAPKLNQIIKSWRILPSLCKTKSTQQQFKQTTIHN